MTVPNRQHPSERSRLLTLVFTDLVDSVGLKTRLGDSEAGRLINEHHQLIQNLVAESGGRMILVAGDGCFVTFETPSEAVKFALLLQDQHRKKTSLPNVRIGIHMGEVTERENPSGSPQPVDVEGLAVDMASRIQSLALPAQILLSYPVFDNARQRLDASQWNLPVEWRAHGHYLFQGTDQSLDVYEVGLKGIAPFIPPTGGSKAHRDVHDEEEATLGWRPAQGQTVPGRAHWILKEKLGEGGFGDVWLVEHPKTGERHVVKFCYSSDRLRALKREVTLFRLLKETLGTRSDIARVLDFQFDTTPYYIEIEFAGKNTLMAWLAEQGGAAELPLELRLELVAQVADAIAAAHSVGVLHKDIKPSNIMITHREDGSPGIKVIDFGIGAVENRSLLDDKGITATGLTEMRSQKEYGSSLTGTRLYMAPELIEGKSATTKSDIYSIGVLLYQMASGKMGQSLAPGWERDIPDALLREDIAACVDGDPANRLSSAEELSFRLRSMPERRIEVLRKEEKARQEALRHQRSHQRRIAALLIGGGLLVLLLLSAVYAMVQSQRAESEAVLRKQAEQASAQALAEEIKTHVALQKAQQARYYATIALAEARQREMRFDKAQDILLEDPPANILGREWGWLLAQTSPEDFALTNHNFFDAAFTPDGKQILIGSRTRDGDGYIAFYDAATAKRTTEVVTNKRLVWNLAISPDGRYVATASSDDKVAVVDMNTKKVLATLSGHNSIVRDVMFSPDSKLLASCGRDHTVRLWTTSDMQPYKVFRVDKDKPTEVSFSPDSRYLASATLEGHVRIYDVTSGTEICRLGGKLDGVLSVVFFANGKGIAATSSDQFTNLYHWPPRPGQTELKPYYTVKAEDTFPSQVISSPDGEALYIGNDNGKIVKINSATGAEELAFTVDQPLWKIALCSGGRRLLTTSRWSMRMIDLQRIQEDTTVTELANNAAIPESAVPMHIATVFDPRDKTWKKDEPWVTTSGLSLAQTSFGKQFVLTDAYTVRSPDGTQLIDINPKSLQWQAKSTTNGQALTKAKKRGLCVGAVYSPDGTKAAVMYDYTRTVVYDTSTWKALYTIKKKNSPISALFTADSRKFLLADTDGTVIEYNAADGKKIRQLRPKGGGSALAMTLSANQKLLALGLDQDRAVVYDMETGEKLSTMSGHVRYIYALQFTPDGKRLATLSRDGTAKLWDVESGRELVTLFRLINGEVPLAIHFGKKGRHISVATSNRRIVTTDVFPWNLSAYGNSTASLEMRVEAWKRHDRLNPHMTFDATEMAD